MQDFILNWVVMPLVMIFSIGVGLVFFAFKMGIAVLFLRAAGIV